jgi:hypothetical protein
MDEITQALEKLRLANVLTAKERALDFANAAFNQLSKDDKSIAALCALVSEQEKRLETVKTRLETLERRLGILTHG